MARSSASSRRILAKRIADNRAGANAATFGQENAAGRSLAFVKVTAGSVADGWSCRLVDSTGIASGPAWTRIRTIPGGEELEVDGIYPCQIDEIAGRPIIIA